MTHVKKKHMTRWGLEPRTYRRPCKYSDYLANGPHGEPAYGRVVVLLPRSVWTLPGTSKKFFCDGAHMKES